MANSHLDISSLENNYVDIAINLLNSHDELHIAKAAKLNNTTQFTRQNHNTIKSEVQPTSVDPSVIHEETSTALPYSNTSATREEKVQERRARNKIHARLSRKRKKDQIEDLKTQVNELKKIQISLKCSIMEKPSINLVEELKSCASTQFEKILKRPTEDIPDVLKTIAYCNSSFPSHGYSGDDINYNLIAKNKTKCSPSESDIIQRERNRLHARRTRYRKKRFLKMMNRIVVQLEAENDLLTVHLRNLCDMDAQNLRAAPPTLEFYQVESCQKQIASLFNP